LDPVLKEFMLCICPHDI